MPDISKTYEKVAENVIRNLKLKCQRGTYSEGYFRTAIRGLNKFYPLDKLEWMRDCLTDQNQHIASGCLECLCSHGMNIFEVNNVLEQRIDDKIFSTKAIEIAEKQNSPETLILYMDEEKGYVNRVIIALKKTHNEAYMTTLMMSDNDNLVRAVNKMTNDL